MLREWQRKIVINNNTKKELETKNKQCAESVVVLP